ncbi:MAG TPA: MFS transporter, partial [Actinomycetospora sp.]|nr:MFS transporter [Actinomycetospora sp.]
AIVDANDVEGPAKYTTYLIIMTGLLAVGFVANEFNRPVDPKHYVSDAERYAPEGSAAAEERRQGARR